MFGGAQDYFRRFSRNLRDQVIGRLSGYTSAVGAMGDMADTAADTMQGMGDMPGFNARDAIISNLMQLPMDWASERGAQFANKHLGGMSKIRRGGSKASYVYNTVGDRMHEYLTAPDRNW